jgi:hypothetical protein
MPHKHKPDTHKINSSTDIQAEIIKALQKQISGLHVLIESQDKELSQYKHAAEIEGGSEYIHGGTTNGKRN